MGKPCFAVFGQKWDQNGLKMRFFRYYQKLVHGPFLVFCMNLHQNKDVKLKQMVSRVFRPMKQMKVLGQKGSKICFSGIIKSQCILTFRFLAWSYVWQHIEIEQNDVYRKTLLWSFWPKKGPKWVLNEVYFCKKSMHGAFPICYSSMLG